MFIILKYSEAVLVEETHIYYNNIRVHIVTLEANNYHVKMSYFNSNHTIIIIYSLLGKQQNN